MKNRCNFVYAGLSIFMTLIFMQPCEAQIWKKIANKVEEKTTDRVLDDVDKVTEKSLDKADSQSGEGDESDTQNNLNSETGISSSETPSTSIKSYQNYDFVPGDNIIFMDDFTEDQVGEFPAHWTLESGQAVVNRVGNIPAFFLTDGNYVKVAPKMKSKEYLAGPFTIEFDTYNNGEGSESPVLVLKYNDQNGDSQEGEVTFSRGDNNGYGSISLDEFPHTTSAQFPSALKESYENHWHHCAVIFKDDQLKCYVDQYRILTMPNLGCAPNAFAFEGIAEQDSPIMITNVRVASGGEMNMVGKKFTASKIVTHGINFDLNKASLKPESMGTLNMIVNLMKSNPSIKFEIDGYTDNSGSAEHNLTLSQQRSEAVKNQLVKMGISSSRLSTKGFGDASPISENTTLAGRANNRRVEFVKV
ncbi:hypothetical protein EI546_04885 [Aequorivita sp. H23M31]|uniref:OmpA-like domain-containing protein n=1 Tax=Aequorivita ciconiae TaxID=2494375 RepID=A0A410G1F6_9FLAO|nr:OmpA family protein [Aequorivita sp. H23M31]QAA81103.1 hypothetical protein EI546_04885 [Aequorivita sp. H23M31]